MFYILQF